MRRLALIAVLAALSMGANSETGSLSSAPDPVKISGDKFVVDDTHHEATFTGKVVVVRKKLNVWAEKVVVEYGEGGPSDIKTFVATGRVRIKTPDQDATGDKAVYDPNTQLLHLTGHVIVVNSSGTVGSPELVVNMITNTSTFTATTGTRVTGVFTPQ
ncbi:MAG TPA: LptA/OstA family protein [Devosia sp.]|jgi:lipopolysaccharide export system protein LptA|nr:LptA/OstA family protein [Devosia sp.]